MLCYTLVLLFSIDVLAAHTRRSTPPVVDDNYIVVLKAGVDLSAHIENFSNASLAFDGDNTFSIEYTYNITLNGYSAKFTGAALDAVRSDPSVEYVMKDSIVSTDSKSTRSRTTGSAARALVDRGIRRPSSALGLGVEIYVLDTGIYTAHRDFGGRASWGAVFGPYSEDDYDGHGTLVTSLAIGAHYGVATAAKAIAVKVLSDSGFGRQSDLMAGIEWSVKSALKSKKQSIVNISIDTRPNTPLWAATVAGIKAGVHFTSCAGNGHVDASTRFAGQVQNMTVVGAVDNFNRMAKTSNYGPAVDVFDLGVNIKGAGIDGPDSTTSDSGTSLSCATVSGILAAALSKIGPMSPYELCQSLKRHAMPVVWGQPPESDTTNLLAQIFLTP